MKQIKILAILFTFSLFMVGCEDTNENLVTQRGANVIPVISDLSPAAFTTDVQNSYIAFTVSVPEGETVNGATIEIATDSSSAELQTISSLPADVRINAVDAANALGISLDKIVPGSVFYVYVLTEKNGKTTRSLNGTLIVNVFCAFYPELTVGSYHEVSTSWAVEGDVTFAADPNDPYKILIHGMQAVEGLTGNGNDVEINIDPDTYAITGGTTVLAADLSEWGYDYTNYSFTVVSGQYSPCDGSFEVTFDINVDQGGWGPNSFTFTRK